MLLPPLEVILSWPTPNYVDPVTRGPALVIVNSIFITLATLTVCARMYTRLIIKQWFGIDDVFILLALAFTIGLTAVVLLANEKYGWDRHEWDVPISQIVPTYKIAMSAKVIFTAAATFTRLSLHCFYYRLVADSGVLWFKWLVHINVAYTVGTFIALTFMAIFFCTPVQNYWTIGAPAETCMDEAIMTMVCGVINSVADLLTTLTPMPLVFRLQMPLHQRFAVAMLFGMGFIVTAAGIVRTCFIYRSLFNEWDQTWLTYPLWIAAAVEIDLGVICASTPVLKPLLAKIPFSLSKSLNCGISFKRSTGNTSQTLTPGASAAYSSRRKSEALRNVPELANDKGQSYEMKHWSDAEAGLMRDDSERGSEGAILHEEQQPKKGMTRLLDKLRSRNPSEDMDRDMTITMTSEVELQSEPSPTCLSLYEKHGGLHENHMPLPPLAARLDGYER